MGTPFFSCRSFPQALTLTHPSVILELPPTWGCPAPPGSLQRLLHRQSPPSPLPHAHSPLAPQPSQSFQSLAAGVGPGFRYLDRCTWNPAPITSGGPCQDAPGLGKVPFPSLSVGPQGAGLWPGPEQAFLGPHRLCPLFGFGGLSLLPGLSRVSLLRLMGLGQVWIRRALIHGPENPSLVICQLSPRPGPVTGPPTSLSNLGLGALKGPCPFIVCETPPE